MINFIIGLFLGTHFGIILMCLFQINKGSDDNT